ncbi:YceI family protein [Streptomyces sp. NPDC094438]|uniref:YceI family protein n=1 Tax=Streptomyces sp. NPDC094438 TaxID=3366061 RepID=UPI003813F754
METNQHRTTAAPGLGRYEIDPGASTVTFTTRHVFGLLPVHGSFAVRSGTVDITEPLTGSRVHAVIDPASFHTGSRRRDTAVCSARFLDTARHPSMTYTADRLDGTSITGMLTVCGVAQPVTLSIEKSASSAGAFTARATTRIDRTRFGVTAARGMAGRHLDVRIEVRCVRP